MLDCLKVRESLTGCQYFSFESLQRSHLFFIRIRSWVERGHFIDFWMTGSSFGYTGLIGVWSLGGMLKRRKTALTPWRNQIGTIFLHLKFTKTTGGLERQKRLNEYGNVIAILMTLTSTRTCNYVGWFISSKGQSIWIMHKLLKITVGLDNDITKLY